MTVATETRPRHQEKMAARSPLKALALALALVALIGCTVFVTAWRRVAFIDIGYEIRQLEGAESRLLHLQNELEIEKAMLSSPERIEKVARGRLGLTDPGPEQIRKLP